MKKVKGVIWFLPVIVAIGLYLWIYTAVSAESLSPTDATRINWENEKPITAVSTEAEVPEIAVSPNYPTTTIMTVAYHREKDLNEFAFDIYYAQSTDRGDSWPITGTIHAQENRNSSQIDIDYDTNNIVHAVWLMGTDTIVYADETMWVNNMTTTLGMGDDSLTPAIVASGSITLDVVWSGFNGMGYSIYHMRSTSGGATWPAEPTPISTRTTIPILSTPALAVHGSKVYAAWEDNPNFPDDQGIIYYTESSDGMSWDTPIPVSNPDHNAHEASIIIDDTRVTVVYTHRADRVSQWLYRTTCLLNDDCTQTTNWTPHSEIEQISGAAVGVNAESPWNVFSDLIEYDGCTYAHFHGTSPIFAQENEVIWSTSSCNEWTVNDDTQALTAPQVQTVFPSLAKDDTYLYLVYQQNKVGDENHQIVFQRGETGDPIPRNNLTITFEGGGEGSIDLRPQNIYANNVCTGTCTRAFDVESVHPENGLITTTVFMYPTAADGSKFEEITGDTGCAEGAVLMASDMECTAHFSRAASIYLPIILK